jgi:hypothetical protein
LDAIVLEKTGALSDTVVDITIFSGFKMVFGNKTLEERVEVIVGCVWGVW